MRLFMLVLVVLVVVGAVVFFTLGADLADRRMNVVLPVPALPVSAEAQRVHALAHVVDLHADALLWPRDLNTRHDHGHVDVPRLLEGNVTLQVFSVVTKAPRGLNYERNDASTDNVTLLAVAQRYPVRAWSSLLERARWQATRLQRAADASGGRLRVIRSSGELQRLVDDRAAGRQVVGGLLATEGLHALDGRLEAVDTLWASGFRLYGLTHFFDNEVGGSAHGVERGGLTPLGRSVLARIEALGGIVDVAHASPTLVNETLAATTRPIVVSHTGVQATCPGARNLTDDQLRRIAARGGIVGIGYWDGAICVPNAANFAKAVVHAVAVAGEDHVALGSDFDGSTKVPFHTGDLTQATVALLEAGLTPDQVQKVLGGNAVRFFLAHLPA